MTDKFDYTATQYASSKIHLPDGPVADLLRRRLSESYVKIKAQTDGRIFEPMFIEGMTAHEITKPGRFVRARHLLAERLVDLAEWVGGYDVREDYR